MTKPMLGETAANLIGRSVPDSVLSWNDSEVSVSAGLVWEICRFLKEDPELDFQMLVALSAVDFIEYFELVYHLSSLNNNTSLVLKARCYSRENPTIPSVVSLWQGADFQEREIYDLMGVVFEGHPNMKRIFLWEGFHGYPLRKDYLEDPRR